jgi:predicted nucleotidyltransferase component of viral defense system
MLHYETLLPNTRPVLEAVFKLPITERFFLAGGTSLALQIGHRLSYDLDCFFIEPFEQQYIIEMLPTIGDTTVMNQNKIGMMTTVAGVKVDFVYFNSPLLEPPIEVDGLKLYSLSDIAAMKILAVTNRGRKRDFFDIYFMLKQLSLAEMLELYKKKYKVYELMMATKSLVYFEDAEEDEDPVLINRSISWNEVKDTISDQLRLFHG